TIQINGQLATIPRSLEVCLRSFRSQEPLIFAWPICVPMHRMIDSSWICAIFATIYPGTARVFDAASHLANLPSEHLGRLIRESESSQLTSEPHAEITSEVQLLPDQISESLSPQPLEIL